MRFKDQLNRTLEFSKPPERIVSLVPSQTELLVDLGLGERLVGITKFCVHPESLRKEVTLVGGTKAVHFEKITALSPDIIICNKEENTQEIVDSCSEIAPTWVSDIYSIEDSLEMIQLLGDIFDIPEVAAGMIAEIVSAKEDFLAFIKNHPKKMAAYLIWKNPYMAAGRNTFINSLLALNHFENVIQAEDTRYPEVNLEDLSEASVILLSSEPYPFKETDVLALKKALSKEVVLVDGEFFSWYGSRLRLAFNYFKTLHQG